MKSLSKLTSPGKIFSGPLPDLPGALGAGSFAIEPLSNLPNASVAAERALLLAKSKILPSWLSISIPVDNDPMPLKQSKNNGPFTEKSAEGNIRSFAKGFVRGTKYRVRIGQTKASIVGFDNIHDINFSCSNASMPGKALSTIEVRNGKSRKEKLPYEASYDDFRLTFQVSEDMKERTVFENWMRYIYNEQTNNFAYPNDYYAHIEVIQLDINMNGVKTAKMLEAYPTNLGAITRAYDADNAIETFEVQFAYSTFEIA